MIMKKVLFIMAVSAMAAGCADNSIPKAQLPELDLSNPLLAAWDTPHETPPFSEIKLADYEPAFDAAIACSRAEIDAIVNNPKKPTFGNTIVALERQGELLNRIAGLFFNLLEADTSDEMQQIAQRVQPKLTELSNDISLNPELFARVKQVYEHPGRLRKEDRKLLEDTYQSFARSGAALSDADKELYRKYTSELSGLTLRFGQNALAATNAFTLNITDPKVVAELPAFVREGMAAEAKARGYAPGRFSFNVSGGRCEACKGDGQIKIEMHFLPDVYVPCEVCNGERYNRETLQVTYRGKNISEVLDMTVEDALHFFENIPGIKRKLQTLFDVGLGYIRLGQPATTLSGGEAQRVKLATELSRRATGRTIYILDEPTTGLHMADVHRLIDILQLLADAGNTVLVIEHNLDVIKVADYIVDLGPEGGSGGGQIVACGTPEQIAACPESFTGQYLKKLLK